MFHGFRIITVHRMKITSTGFNRILIWNLTKRRSAGNCFEHVTSSQIIPSSMFFFFRGRFSGNGIRGPNNSFETKNFCGPSSFCVVVPMLRNTAQRLNLQLIFTSQQFRQSQRELNFAKKLLRKESFLYNIPFEPSVDVCLRGAKMAFDVHFEPADTKVYREFQRDMRHTLKRRKIQILWRRSIPPSVDVEYLYGERGIIISISITEVVRFWNSLTREIEIKTDSSWNSEPDRLLI